MNTTSGTKTPSWKAFLLLGTLCAVSASLPAQEGPQLRIETEDGHPRVAIACGDEVLLRSPAEGLWSVAMDWQDQWPADWAHAHPGEPEQAGAWTILHGVIDTPSGSWRVSDAYRPQGRVVQCIRRFVWEGKKPTDRCTLSVRFQTPGTGAGVLMPGILYYGNPSGARSGKVPVYTGTPGEEAFFEEHRFPMPFASLEWPALNGRRGAAIHTLPSPTPFGNLKDQWWSLGMAASEGMTEFALLSGPCAANGQRSVVKAIQPGFIPYEDAYLTVAPGAIIEKSFCLEAYPVDTAGSGFQRPVQTALERFAPYTTEGLPSFREIIEAKYRYAQTRWCEHGGAAGFRKYHDRDIFVLGWCGQAAAPGYALQVLYEKLGAPEALDQVQRSLDFLAGAQFYEGGFHTWYDCRKKEWSRHEPLSQGQAMLNFANAIRVGREQQRDTARWEDFLRRACDFHATRILAEDWKPVSTDEAFFIAPLCESYRLFGAEVYRNAAEKAGRTYASRHLSMKEPYWGGTLDASCEDKEGAFAALQGFLALQQMTGDANYLTWAAHAGDAALTYTVLWDIDLPPGRLRDHAFKTRGWTAVSAQNQHIDVYGVLIAPEIYRLGALTHREDLQQLAVLMYRSCGQLLDPYGSQGEQPQHTNYAQRGNVDNVFALRGGYVEDWTVFWITAHFLNAAAQFVEMDVPVWE